LRWAEQAEALGWTARDLFGLTPAPDKAAANYRRLSRYDLTGLIWLLRGRSVVALTEATAAIKHPRGAVTTYRRHNKPAFGPIGDIFCWVNSAPGGLRQSGGNCQARKIGTRT
jgi:hypothetical protein